MAPTDPTKPGDEAPPGAPGTGENLCPACSGKGKVDGNECPSVRALARSQLASAAVERRLWRGK